MKLSNTLDANQNRITNLPAPVAASDPATRAYADALANGKDWKASCRLATIAALPANTRIANVLTANANGALANIDGVAAAVNDRILVKNEANTVNNGVYTVTALGGAGAPWVMTRAADADEDAEVTAGMTTFVTEGGVNHDTEWLLITDDPIVLNVTGLVFTQSNSTSITAGNGLVQNGNAFDVNPGPGIQLVGDAVQVDTGVVARKVTALIGNGAATNIAVAHNLNNQFVGAWAYDAATNAVILVDYVLTDANTVTFSFSVAPANNSVRVVVVG